MVHRILNIFTLSKFSVSFHFLTLLISKVLYFEEMLFHVLFSEPWTALSSNYAKKNGFLIITQLTASL